MTTKKTHTLYVVNTITYTGVKKAIRVFLNFNEVYDFYIENFLFKDSKKNDWKLKSQSQENVVFENLKCGPWADSVRFVDIETLKVTETAYASAKLLLDIASFSRVVFPKVKSGISSKLDEGLKTAKANLDEVVDLSKFFKSAEDAIGNVGKQVNAGLDSAAKTLEEMFVGKKKKPQSDFDNVFGDMSQIFEEIFGKPKSETIKQSEAKPDDYLSKLEEEIVRGLGKINNKPYDSQEFRKPQAFNLDEILKILTEGPENHTDKSASDKRKSDNEERLTKIVSDLENAGFKVNLTVNGKKIKSKKPEVKKGERPFEERLTEILKARPDVIPEIEKLLKKKK